jgi:hypothetical protein
MQMVGDRAEAHRGVLLAKVPVKDADDEIS